MIEGVASLITSVGLGLGAGVNAYATFLVFGLLSRFYPLLFQSDLATFFASTPVLVTVGVLYVIEFAADKFPGLDHIWDAIHTFIRPAAGALVAFASSTPEMPQGVAILAAVLGGGAALGSHLTKSAIRATSTATTGGVANPALSVGEDVFAIGQSLLAVFLPFVFLALMAAFLLALMAWLLRPRRGRI